MKKKWAFINICVCTINVCTVLWKGTWLINKIINGYSNIFWALNGNSFLQKKKIHRFLNSIFCNTINCVIHPLFHQNPNKILLHGRYGFIDFVQLHTYVYIIIRHIFQIIVTGFIRIHNIKQITDTFEEIPKNFATNNIIKYHIMFKTNITVMFASGISHVEWLWCTGA